MESFMSDYFITQITASDKDPVCDYDTHDYEHNNIKGRKYIWYRFPVLYNEKWNRYYTQHYLRKSC